MRTSTIALSLFFLHAAAACEVVGADDSALEELEGPALTTVARAVISGGIDHEDTWDFNEAEPGELFVHAILSDRSAQRYPWLREEIDLSYVEMYQKLTGKPAPRALIDAQARADARTDEEDEAEDTSGLVTEAGGWASPTAGRLTQQISADDFEDDYCFLFDYLYCWPSFYGSPYVQRKQRELYGYVAAVNNTVDFRLRYKKHSYSGWTTLVSAQAQPGEVHYVHTQYNGYNRWRRWEVLDNGNNLVRYSTYGWE